MPNEQDVSDAASPQPESAADRANQDDARSTEGQVETDAGSQTTEQQQDVWGKILELMDDPQGQDALQLLMGAAQAPDLSQEGEAEETPAQSQAEESDLERRAEEGDVEALKLLWERQKREREIAKERERLRNETLAEVYQQIWSSDVVSSLDRKEQLQLYSAAQKGGLPELVRALAGAIVTKQQSAERLAAQAKDVEQQAEAARRGSPDAGAALSSEHLFTINPLEEKDPVQVIEEALRASSG
ncbi:MAG: hypothetical protein QW838_04225 [Candidatus Nitrosotenuis sp.]